MKQRVVPSLGMALTVSVLLGFPLAPAGAQGTTPPVPGNSPQAAFLPVSFDAAMYGLFVSPYPDLARRLETSTPALATRLAGLRVTAQAVPGFRLLGTWTSAERVLSPWDAAGPGSVQVYTRSTPSVAHPQEQGQGVAVIAGQWRPDDQAFRAHRARFAEAGFLQSVWRQGLLSESCRPVNIYLEDHPALRSAVTRTCLSEYRTRRAYVQVWGVNLTGKETTAALKAAVSDLNADR